MEEVIRKIEEEKERVKQLFGENTPSAFNICKGLQRAIEIIKEVQNGKVD